jgi:hypothetical protein
VGTTHHFLNQYVGWARPTIHPRSQVALGNETGCQAQLGGYGDPKASLGNEKEYQLFRIPMAHSYEEIRSVALDIISGREQVRIEASNYENLKYAIAKVFERREGYQSALPRLDNQDSDIFREVFWDLFRQGIITLGLNDLNPQFPHFRATKLGKQIADSQSVYFFHDVSSYERVIRSEIPRINDVTLLYLKEAMQAFYSGCLLSATVMLGVAAEHTFQLLLEIIENNSIHQKIYSIVFKERNILPKINKFRKILEQNINVLSSEIKEDLDTHFAGIQSVIRTFRNQSGHPTGKIIDREQSFVLLQLFIPYCKKLYQLMDFFR